MSFVESIKTVFTKYADFNGRARRSEYWWFALFSSIVSSVLSALTTSTGSGFFSALSVIFSLGILVPSLAVSVRRLHDIGKKWTWILIGLIPVVGGIILIIWCAKDSDFGENEFGPNPKE